MATQHLTDKAPGNRNIRITKPALFDAAWNATEDIHNPTIVELKRSARKLVDDLCELTNWHFNLYLDVVRTGVEYDLSDNELLIKVSPRRKIVI